MVLCNSLLSPMSLNRRQRLSVVTGPSTPAWFAYLYNSVFSATIQLDTYGKAVMLRFYIKVSSQKPWPGSTNSGCQPPPPERVLRKTYVHKKKADSNLY